MTELNALYIEAVQVALEREVTIQSDATASLARATKSLKHAREQNRLLKEKVLALQKEVGAMYNEHARHKKPVREKDPFRFLQEETSDGMTSEEEESFIS